VNAERGPAYPPLALWGVFLSILAGVAVLFFSPDVSTPVLLGGAAAVVLVVALLLAVSRRSVQESGGGADPDDSPATVWLALSLALTALGAALGPWLALIGGGMSAVGAVGVLREVRAQSRAARGDGARR
jgi:hypothetical protein